RTWEEVISVVSLLTSISQRSELFTHDVAILSVLAESIAQKKDVRVLREIAEPLFGLDPDLDALLDIQATGGAQRERWEETVTRLALERRLEIPNPFDSKPSSD